MHFILSCLVVLLLVPPTTALFLPRPAFTSSSNHLEDAYEQLTNVWQSGVWYNVLGQLAHDAHPPAVVVWLTDVELREELWRELLAVGTVTVDVVELLLCLFTGAVPALETLDNLRVLPRRTLPEQTAAAYLAGYVERIKEEVFFYLGGTTDHGTRPGQGLLHEGFKVQPLGGRHPNSPLLPSSLVSFHRILFALPPAAINRLDQFQHRAFQRRQSGQRVPFNLDVAWRVAEIILLGFIGSGAPSLTASLPFPVTPDAGLHLLNRQAGGFAARPSTDIDSLAFQQFAQQLLRFHALHQLRAEIVPHTPYDQVYIALSSSVPHLKPVLIIEPSIFAQLANVALRFPLRETATVGLLAGLEKLTLVVAPGIHDESSLSGFNDEGEEVVVTMSDQELMSAGGWQKWLSFEGLFKVE